MTVTITVLHIYDTDEHDEYWIISDSGNEWDDDELDDFSQIEDVVDERRGRHAAKGHEVVVIYH